MLKFKTIKLSLCIMIIISLFANLTYIAYTNVMLGDLNSDNRFNAIDISLLRLQLHMEESYNEAADMNTDNIVDLKDLVRMKRYLSEEIINNSIKNEGFVWNVLNGTDDFAIVTGIGYVFYTHCNTVTVYFSGRYVWETSAYISTDIYANPEYPQPNMTISYTGINDDEVTMQEDNNIIGIPNKIIKKWTSYEEYYVPNRSNCKNEFSIMFKDAIYPYRKLTNEFIF